MQGKDLRIVFMGTPDFAVSSLKELIDNGYNIVGVITTPDKPAGRGQKIHESAVKKYAVENKLIILQPEKLKNPDFIKELQELKADLQIVVAFRMLPEIVWNMPPLGTFNLHASLLPQYRGAAPLNWAIINGDKESGVTTFLLDHKIDTGRILLQEKVTITENDNVGTLHDKLMAIGSKLVLKTVDLLAEGKAEGIAQNELSTANDPLIHAPKIFKEDCKIKWNDDVSKIHNLIRGLSPYPCSWSELINRKTGKKTTIKIYGSNRINKRNAELEIGSIITNGKNELAVVCKNGLIQINELQLSGKKRMKTDDFVRGFQQVTDCKFI